MWIIPGLVSDENVTQSMNFFKDLYQICSENDKEYLDKYIEKGENLVVREGLRQGKDELQNNNRVRLLDNELKSWFNNGIDIENLEMCKIIHDYIIENENTDPFYTDSSETKNNKVNTFLSKYDSTICGDWYPVIQNWFVKFKYSKLKPSTSVFLNSDLTRKSMIKRGLEKALQSGKPSNWRSL